MKIRTLATAVALVLSAASVANAEDANASAMHRLAIHVDQNDPAVMNLVLNNVQNVEAAYAAKGETVAVEIVAYGPGLQMLTADSPVKERISVMALEHPDNLQFSACGNTIAGLKKKTGQDVTLVSEAKIVPAGVIRLMELQEAGWSYLRP